MRTYTFWIDENPYHTKDENSLYSVLIQEFLHKKKTDYHVHLRGSDVVTSDGGLKVFGSKKIKIKSLNAKCNIEWKNATDAVLTFTDKESGAELLSKEISSKKKPFFSFGRN